MGLLNDILEKLLSNFLSLKEDDWVEWISQLNNWRDDCDKFNGCHFILKQMPRYPQHPNCQCRLEKIENPIPNITANANCDIRKFTDYIFSDKYDDDKKDLFENWGYTIADSAYLQQLFVSQTLQKYCKGDYIYKGAGKFYAHIEIVIEVPAKSGKSYRVKTGWAVLPKGEIKLTTPFSGFSN